MKRTATAIWNGTIKEGSGNLSTASNVLNKTQYSFKSRFEEGIGTNPEELLAAAHAGCFTMKLSLNLTEAGYNPDELMTESTIHMADGKISKSELVVTASVPGIAEHEFQKLAQDAEKNCPVSKAFAFEITMEARLQ